VIKIISKKAQITVFILLGIVMTSAFSFLFYTKNQNMKTGAAATILSGLNILEKKPVEAYAMTCLKKVSENALFNISFQGGYFDPTCTNDYSTCTSMPYYDDAGQKIPIFYDGINFLNISLNEMEEKLSKYIIEKFENCLNFDIFEESGYNITSPSIHNLPVDYNLRNGSGVRSIVSINEEDVTVKVIYPIKIKVKEKVTEVSDFRISIPIGLSRIHRVSSILLDTIKNGYPLPTEYNIGSDCTTYDSEYAGGFCSTDISIYINKKATPDPSQWIIAVSDVKATNRNRWLYHYGKIYSFYFAVQKANLTGECYYNMEGSC